MHLHVYIVWGQTKLNTFSQLIIGIHLHLSSQCTHNFSNPIITREKKWKGSLIQNPNYEIPSLPLHASKRTVIIEK